MADMQPLLWSLPVLGFMYYFTFSYQVLFLWAIIFAFITWMMTLSIMNIFREFCENRKPDGHCQDSTDHRHRHLLCRSVGYPDLVK